MEQFKKFEEILTVDSRSASFCVTNRNTGDSRMISLRDGHEAMDALELSSDVPEDVLSQFNIARNLAVFSWFSYSFHQVAELKALSTLEYALKKRLNRSKLGLSRLLVAALEQNLFYDRDFKHIEPPSDEQDQSFCKTLISNLPKYRNTLAHGSTMLHPNSSTTLYVCHCIIGKLYEKT